MRKVKSAVPGATINDGVLATVGGALRRYLSATGELPETSLIAMAPISVRSADEKESAGNQVSGMTVLLGTDIADAGERLVVVQRSTHEQKEFSSAVNFKYVSGIKPTIQIGTGETTKKGAKGFSRITCVK